MGSQSNIAHTSFLEDCISKKRSVQDIHEALGLYSEIADTRKEPVFHKDEANDLHKRIKEIAESFKTSYRNDRENMLADLVKDGVFATEVQELGQLYGQTLWTRRENWPTRYAVQQGAIPDELNWDKEADRESICFYIRCWITRHAVQVLMPRKGKAKASTVVRDFSEGEQAETNIPRTQLRPDGVAPSDLPFRAPEVTSLLPPNGISRTETTTIQTRPGDNASLGVTFGAEARSPTTPNKRKALSFQEHLASGKLQKVLKEARANTDSPQGRQRDVYSGPRSPTPLVQTNPVGRELREQEENIDETDRTWEPAREETAETETVVDPDEMMTDTQELLSGVLITSGQDTSRTVRSPTTGPSGTYRNPQRQDSVIPPSTGYSAEHLRTDQGSANNNSRELWHSSLIPTTQTTISRLDPWQEKQLRMELFKLLLSHLNGINQFRAETYQPESEDRMDTLLYQFWFNDTEALRLQVGDKLASLQTALRHWMNMRHLLTEFRRTTGYFGKPGDEWKEHLKRMNCIPHAQASIAFVDLKSSASMSGLMLDDGPTFDTNLANVFDLLTQVEGCNGIEEFQALRIYNEGLREWFS